MQRALRGVEATAAGAATAVADAGAASSDVRSNLLLFSFAYGADIYRDPVLRLFLKTAAGSGADFVMLSTLNASARKAGVQLPSNVRERHVHWQKFSSLLRGKFFANGQLSNNRPLAFASAHPFKAHDIKPLLPLLFPGLVQGYAWWGWVDWDTWVGDLRRLQTFLRGYVGDVWTPGLTLWKAWLPDRRCATDSTVKSLDVAPGTVAGIDSCAQKVSWGPLTVLRNTPTYARIWTDSHNRRAVRFMLQQDGNTQFDEWGEVAYAHKASNDSLAPVGYANSFSGILYRESRKGTLRLPLEPSDAAASVHSMQAGAMRCRDDSHPQPCHPPSVLRPSAGYCRVRITPSGVTRLFHGSRRGSTASAQACMCESEGIVCHFPFKDGRRAAWRQLDPVMTQTLLDARELVATFDASHSLGLYSPGLDGQSAAQSGRRRRDSS